MNDLSDQSKILTIHRSKRSSFWQGFTLGFIMATILFAVVIAEILEKP